MNCAICLAETFDHVTTASRSAMVNVDGTLESRTRRFEIGRCRTCDHVQVTSPQTQQALFELYQTYIYKESSDNKTEPRRCKGVPNVGPDRNAQPILPHYADLVSYCQPHVLVTKDAIVDLGCGPGTILRYLRDAYELPAQRLIGIDFISHLSPEHGIDLVLADLNALDESSELACLPEKIGFLFCSHVVEHMIEPRRLFRFARKILAPEGHFYVEVPDHTITHPRNVPGDPWYVPLVAPEHLQYFSLRSLSLLAQTCGFEIVKAERTQSYDGFLPRLKLLLRPAPDSGVGAVVAYCLDRSDGRWPEVGARVVAAIETNRQLALWGCGFGLLQMLGGDSRLEKLIAERGVMVVDNQQFGKKFGGAPIRDESALRGFDGIVVMTPALPASRETMRANAAAMGISPDRTIDPYV